MAVMVLAKFGFSPETLFAKAVGVHPKGDAIAAPAPSCPDPVQPCRWASRRCSLSAGITHLIRFFTVKDARAAREVDCSTPQASIGYFYILTFIIGFGAIVHGLHQPDFLTGARGLTAIRSGST